jgi:predicted nucleic acid-binding protein
MRRVVVDSAIVLGWFTGATGPARSLRTEYEHGTLTIVAPRSLPIEMLDATAEGTGWPADRLAALAADLDRLGFELRDPPGSEMAAWLARGLSGADAAYAALASALDIPLVTTDPELLRTAGIVAQSP